MKKFIITSAIIGAFVSMAFTGSTICDGNETFVQGVKTKMGYYNGDGKQTGTGTTEVTKVYTSGDSTIAVVKSTYEDAKKKEPHTNEFKMICLNGVFIMDMSGAMNSATQSSGSDMQMVVKGNMVPYKSTYTVGEKLDDYTMIMEMYSKGSLVSTTTVVVTDRKIDAFEDRTVPAGTFKCYKMSYTTTATMMMGTMKIPGMKPNKSVMYYCPTSGMIRLESYKDEKISSYQEMLELTKP